MSKILDSNSDMLNHCTSLTQLNSKQLYYRHLGKSSSGSTSIIFIHGLGSTSESFAPLIARLNLEETHALHLLDLEGQGRLPTSASSVISIASYASDVYALFQYAGITQAIIIAHSMGCLVAFYLAVHHPELVSKLVLLGPTLSPLSSKEREGRLARAVAVRASGMLPVADSSAATRVSSRTKLENPAVIDTIRKTLLGQDPEGYAKGCEALARETEPLPVHEIKAGTLIVTGEEDVVAPPAVCEKYASEISGSKVVVLPGVGHWHIFEDVKGVASVVGPFL